MDLARVFHGSNEETEIETVDEFLSHIQGRDPSTIRLRGYVFQQVSFGTCVSEDVWNKLDFTGAEFWGCELPPYTNAEEVRRRGAGTVAEQPTDLPFKPFRAFMYQQDELAEIDAATYQHYLQDNGMRALMNRSFHDHFIQDALFDYIEGKTIVTIMGGHGMKRASQEYRLTAELGWKLAAKGYIVSTGGGPGAMEAANLGAYMSLHSFDALQDAVNIIQTCNADHGYANEYENTQAADAVLDKYGQPSHAGSLGVPTWKYGHEPSNKFATWQAKMFQNSVREDGLIAISNGGIVYTPGSAGTRQEVFQAACLNHYADKGYEVPMVFYDTAFWKESCVYDTLAHNSKGRPFADWLLLTDEIDAIVNNLLLYRDTHNLPVTSLEALKGKHWEGSSQTCRKRRQSIKEKQCSIFTKY